MCPLLWVLGPRPCVTHDQNLSSSISISGGKETDTDSPNNGKQTGSRPTSELDSSAA